MELLLLIDYFDGLLLYVQIRAYASQVVVCLTVGTFVGADTAEGLDQGCWCVCGKVVVLLYL